MNREQFVQKWSYSPECGDGWLHLIDAVLRTVKSQDESFGIRQIKEKFGGLRMYLTTEVQMYPVMDAVERISLMTCEVCGNPGKCLSNEGWFRTRCEEHDF